MLCVLKGIGVNDFPDIGAGNGEVIAVQAREKLDSVPNMQSSYRASSLLDHVVRLHSLSPMNLMLLQLITSSANGISRLIREGV